MASLLGMLPPSPLSAQQAPPVDLLLVLAVDCSYSVSRAEYELQIQGLALAFLDPDIIAACTAGPNGRIAVAVMQWSSTFSQVLSIPWTLLDSPAAVLRFSQLLSDTPRETADGGTALGDALAQAGNLVLTAPYDSFRRVIDVSADGRKNTGSVVEPVRDALIASGVTINALVIINEDPTLNIYFSRKVIGGPGSFVLIANDYQEYQTAIRKKLLREIRFVPVSLDDPPSAEPERG